MANRRLFYKLMIYRADFESLPDRARILYQYLNFEADDDGFVANPHRVILMARATNEDYQALVSAGFIMDFSAGLCAIIHWHQHNIINRDGYQKTEFTEERSQLKISSGGIYYRK